MDGALEWVQKNLSIQLSHDQFHAVKSALHQKVMIITGGPGTGKTTIIQAILKIFSRLKMKILLAAPTGRAAKRMSEATGHEAKTIHRLLEFSFQNGGFVKDDENRLNCDLIIVDEASMVDTQLMFSLLKALPLSSRIVLVGDVYQLPSVGAGNVLGDIIKSQTVTVVELKEIFRQKKTSHIIVNAHKINQGIIPELDSSEEKSDFYFRHREEPDDALQFVIELITDHIPRVFGFDPLNEIQILTPMRKGIVGTNNLNSVLQNTLNPVQDGIKRGNRSFRVNDKVMQITNNYDKEVFNGDMGRIMRINGELQEVVISFENREVVYDFADLDEIILSYAISIHKAQGSEYSAVVIPILTQHYILLQRNLIYTAVTRAKKLVVIVGSKKALALGVKNNKTQKRYTHLQHRLMSNFRSQGFNL